MNRIFTAFSLTAALLLGTDVSMASEIFLKVSQAGQHTVLVNDQYQTNTSNTFRFFDLSAGSIPVKVTDASTGNMVYDGVINLGTDQRVVAELLPTGGLNIIATLSVSYTNWYTETVNTGNNTAVVNPVPVSAPPVGCSIARFNEIVSAIKSQNVESYKLEKAKSIIKKNQFSSRQVADICNLFNVESYKLEVAKFAYDYTVDKENYFIVGKSLKVASYSRELDEYIDKK